MAAYRPQSVHFSGKESNALCLQDFNGMSLECVCISLESYSHKINQMKCGIRTIRHHNKLTSTRFATTESQIATGGDLTFSPCVACRMKLKLKER